MKKRPVDTVARPIVDVIKHYHLTIFFVLVASCLIGGVILINRMIIDGESEGADYQSSISAGSIDEATLLRIQSLHPSTEPDTSLSLPSGRINPFSE